ncbi:MAG TPA: hypothetical protein PK156_21495 [Polyangium sp.]|nr:hypothetical protein [Polyangium sp.]
MSELVSTEKPASVNTRFLLAIAAVLIVNSHLEAFYPVSFLAGDGLFGYALFFFIAGIGLGLSAKRELRTFRDYYWRRFVRIYPTYWLFRLLFAMLDNDFARMTPLQGLRIFVFPTETTFIGPLMVDYAVLYLLLRKGESAVIRRAIYWLMVPVVALWMYLLPHMQLMHSMPLYWLFAGIIEFQMMLFGCYLGETVGPTRKYRFGWDSVAVIFIFGLYLAARIGVQRGVLPPGTYPLLFALLAGLFYFLFQIACSYELDAILKRVPRIGQLITWVGVTTLEMYFVHQRVRVFTWVQAIVFPLNIVALWALSLPIAIAVEKLVTQFRKQYLKVN